MRLKLSSRASIPGTGTCATRFASSCRFCATWVCSPLRVAENIGFSIDIKWLFGDPADRNPTSRDPSGSRWNLDLGGSMTGKVKKESLRIRSIEDLYLAILYLDQSYGTEESS